MPDESSPTTSPRTSTTIPVLTEEHHQRQTNAIRSLRFTGNELQQTGQPNEINCNKFRLVKLPIFWRKQPKLWFAQLGSEFLVYRIRSDDIKYSSVIRHLDEQALVAISEIIENPPEKDKYL